MGRKSKVTVEGNTISGTADAITEVLQQAGERLNGNGREKISLKKAKIKNDLFLEVEYSEVVTDGTNTVKKDCTAPVHDDLKKSFKQLDEHLQSLCQQDDSCSCKGFTIGGSGDHEGIVLVGSREVELGVLNLVSPFVKWDSEYPEITPLSEAIESCKHEVKLYVFEGKHQPEAQQELPFAELEGQQNFDEEE